MPTIAYPPVLGVAHWDKQSKALKKSKSITELGEALKALSKRHEAIDADLLEAGAATAAADIERRRAQVAAAAKGVRAVADDAKELDGRARKLEAELKKDKQPGDAALAVAKAAAAYAGELLKLEQSALGAVGELDKRLAAAKADAKKPAAGADEDSPERKLVLSRVLAGLRAAKNAQPGAPAVQCLIALGNKRCLAYLSNSVGASHRKLLTDLMPDDSGFKFFTGECRWENKAHTFIGDSMPGGLAKKLQQGLFELTKLRVKVRVRKTTGEAEEAEGDEMPDLADDAPGAAAAATPKAAAAPGAGGGEAAKFSNVALQKSRLSWVQMRGSIEAQLKQLDQGIKAAVREHNASAAGDRYDEGEVALGLSGLFKTMGKLDTRLIDKLDEALNATDAAKRKGLHAQATSIVKEYIGFVAADPVIREIDQNGFIKTDIRGTVTRTLTELAGRF